MPLALSIALSHLGARRRQTVVSLLGITFGVAFFLAVAALMQGSEEDFVARLIDNSPHITITDEFRDAPVQPVSQLYSGGAVLLHSVKPRSEVRGIRHYKQKLAAIETLPGVRAAPLLVGQAIVTFAGRDEGVSASGIVPSMMAGVSTIDTKFLAGKLSDLDGNQNGIIIGEGLRRKLSLAMGDNLSVASNTGQVRTFKVIGVFETGNAGYDENQTFIALKRAQALFGRPDRANMFILKLEQPNDARALASQIETSIGGYKAESWQEASQDIEALLKVRNTIMYTVVSAILIVASFGIYNVISTVVLEKTRDIAILKSLGFHARDIRRIFVIEGAIVGVMGSVTGVALGIVLMKILALVEVKSPGSSAAASLPVYWGTEMFVLAVAFAMITSVLAAYLPARKGGNVDPVDILRGAA